jgi:hypothetical protein
VVKRILIILDDDEYEMLKKIKGKRTWKDLLVGNALAVGPRPKCCTSTHAEESKGS